MPVSRRDGGLTRAFTTASLLLILAALCGIHMLVGAGFADARDVRDRTQRSIAVRAGLAELLVLHLSAETGLRGNVLTGRNEVFAHQQAAHRQRAAVFAALEKQGAPATIAALPKLKALSASLLDRGPPEASVPAAGQSGRAGGQVLQGDDRVLKDAMRQSVARLHAAEADELARLERASEEKRREIERLVAFLLVAIAALLVAPTLIIARTAAQRRAALRAARQVAEQERAMFDGAVDGMLLLDAQGRIMRANASMTRMFGYAPDDLVGRDNAILIAHPVAREESLGWLAAVGRAGLEGAGRRQELVGRRADGTTFETEVAISRFGEDGESRFVAALRDISHRKRAERMKSEFVATVSHELRTPLTSIGGSLALLAAGIVGELNERSAQLVAIAHSNCERLIRLINDLLDIEKIESGKMEFDMRRMMLGPLVQRTVSANLQFAHDHQVVLEAGLPPWPQCVLGDPDRLEQVLTNLISNAVKFSPPGQTVIVTTVQREQRVRLEVRDRGSGVPEHFRDRIFTKFAMADGSDARARGGTGLGLAIVREIAERHGGTAGFEDRPGGGSIFHVELPLLGVELRRAQSEPADLPVLLHIDHDVDFLNVVASAFTGRARVLGAATMREARAIIAHRPDIAGCLVDIALDVGGPGNGAAAWLEELREAASDMALIVLTAADVPRDVAADAVLIKSRSPISTVVETTLMLTGAGRRRES